MNLRSANILIYTDTKNNGQFHSPERMVAGPEDASLTPAGKPLVQGNYSLSDYFWTLSWNFFKVYGG
jgi:hypothetical protein